MNAKGTLTAILAFAAIGLMAHSAMAERISIKGHNQDQVQGKCSGDGDVFWIPGKSGKTYGCLHADGSGIVCGGVTADDKKTCDTFRTGSFPVPKFPTRGEAVKAGTAKQ